jgi:hypothetical protein
VSEEALDALEAWHSTTRALRDATPGTAEWVRLRMIAEQQHVAYEALISKAESSEEASSEGSGSSEVRAHPSR